MELGRRTAGKSAGHWVTIVEGRVLVDPTLGQARTKLNPWFNEAGEPMVLEVGLSPNTKVTYALPTEGIVDLNKSSWWTGTNPRKRIASRMKRQFKELFFLVFKCISQRKNASSLAD